MIRKHIQPAVNWIKHVITEPRDELNRWQTFARFMYDLGVHGWKALNRDDAPQMASALAFRTLFALLPVVVVSTIVVRAVGGQERFDELVGGVLTAVGANAVPFTKNEAGNAVSLADWLRGLASDAQKLNLAALGWIGFAVVVYSAIGILVTIENSFNKIYGAPGGRSWTRRIPTYWLLLTMSPVFIGITLYLDNRLGGIIANVGGWSWLLTALKFTWGFCVAWLFMFAVYKLVPNTKVATQAALAGAFIAAAFITLGKATLNAYFDNAVSLESLYGSLGAIPLFMFWVYLMWLVVLFGLEVSATIQTVTMQGLALEEAEEKRPQNGLVDPAAVLPVMEIITERFMQASPVTTREIADETHIAESIVTQIIDHLHREGLVHRLSRDDSAVSLARPPEHICADQLIDIGYKLVDEGGVGRHSALAQRLREAQLSLARQATLASLLPVPARQNSANQAGTA
ncbi:MAG: YihY family inner membrane protein [Phycisphaerales bacterium]|nr:YihY family inner membrane protein [Phycisphaerales bacterium]